MSLPMPRPNSSTVMIRLREGPSDTCSSINDFLEVCTTLNSESPIWNIMLDLPSSTSYLTMTKVPVVEPISLT